MYWLLIIIWIPNIFPVKCSSMIHKDEYCIDEYFKVQCPDKEIMIIANATYGRMEVGRCISVSIQMGCAVGVQNIVNRICSGRNSCKFRVIDELSFTKPCVSGLTSYLEASYQCIKGEYCNNEDFIGQCEKEEVILMLNATYGRMNIGKCIGDNYKLDCRSDVLPITNRLCSGKTSCSFKVIEELSDYSTCALGLTPYLDASYICVKVADLSDKACSDKPHTLPMETTLHLSSEAENAQCGYTLPTWKVKAEPGQTVQVRLLDFTSSSDSPTSCSAMGHLTEAVVRTNRTICGSRGKGSVLVYTSVGHILEVTLLPERMRTNIGLFGLEYKVIGCAETSIPTNVYYRRDGTKAELGCSAEDIRWLLECEGGKWKGEFGNCTDNEYSDNSTGDEFLKLLNEMPEGIIIAIVVGIAVLLSIFVLVCGIAYISKHRHTQDNSSETYSHGPRRTNSEFKMYGPQGRPDDTVNCTPLMYQNTVDKRDMYGTDKTMNKRDMYPIAQPDPEVCSCASYSSIPRILDKTSADVTTDVYLDPVNGPSHRQ